MRDQLSHPLSLIGVCRDATDAADDDYDAGVADIATETDGNNTFLTAAAAVVVIVTDAANVTDANGDET